MKTEREKNINAHTYRCLSSMLQTNEFSELVESKCRQKSTRYECIRIRSSEKICISRKKYTHTQTIWATEAASCIKVASRAENEKNSQCHFLPCSVPLFLQPFNSLNQKVSSPFRFCSLIVFLIRFGWIVHNSSIAMNWADLISFAGNMQRFPDFNLSNRIYLLYS